MTYQMMNLKHFLEDMGVNPEELNRQKFLKEFKRTHKVKVYDIPPTQAHSWRELQMLLYNLEIYHAQVVLILNPTLKLLYLASPEFEGPTEHIPGTNFRILITDSVL